MAIPGYLLCILHECMQQQIKNCMPDKWLTTATIMVQLKGLWCNQIFQSVWLHSPHCGWATGLHSENSKKENTKSKKTLRLTSRAQFNWGLLATCSIAMKANKNDLSK